MITAGIDCGAKNTKSVIMKDGTIIGKASVLTGKPKEPALVPGDNGQFLNQL